MAPRDDVLNHAVRKVVLFGVIAHVLERKHNPRFITAIGMALRCVPYSPAGPERLWPCAPAHRSRALVVRRGRRTAHPRNLGRFNPASTWRILSGFRWWGCRNRYASCFGDCIRAGADDERYPDQGMELHRAQDSHRATGLHPG